MNTRRQLIALFALIGCAADPSDDGSANSSGGKADDVDDLECAPADELSLELLAGDKETSADGDKLTNRVVAACFDSSGFEDAQCCADAGLFDAYRDATSCPEAVEISKVAGAASQQRCRNSSSGSFVDDACCSALCDPRATRNAAGACIDSGGKFEDAMCCFLTAALAADSCEGAAWDTVTIEGNERSACRGADGRFAMNSCCAAECVQAVNSEELSLATIPDACAAKITLEAPADECPDQSRPNAGGICHNPVDGRFVKAACCEALGVVACSFDTKPTFGVDNSSDLVDRLGTDTAKIEREGLSELQTEQLGIAALHLGFLLPGQEQDLDQLFDVPDQGEFFYVSGAINGIAVDWVQFFAGDTEVGIVFEQGTSRVLGEVGDGDILGCTV